MSDNGRVATNSDTSDDNKELLKDWPTLQETASILGVSPRTIQRWNKHKEDGHMIQVRMRHASGFRPVAVCHPLDVNRVAQDLNKPYVMPNLPDMPEPRKETAVAKRESHAAENVAMLAQAIATAVKGNGTVPTDRKLFLSIEEAAEYSGLPKSTLYDTLRTTPTRLGAIKYGSHTGWRINRKRLEETLEDL